MNDQLVRLDVGADQGSIPFAGEALLLRLDRGTLLFGVGLGEQARRYLGLMALEVGVGLGPSPFIDVECRLEQPARLRPGDADDLHLLFAQRLDRLAEELAAPHGLHEGEFADAFTPEAQLEGVAAEEIGVAPLLPPQNERDLALLPGARGISLDELGAEMMSFVQRNDLRALRVGR